MRGVVVAGAGGGGVRGFGTWNRTETDHEHLPR